jgi:thiamine phosphate synthase YjbQ (UPF0047 family)
MEVVSVPPLSPHGRPVVMKSHTEYLTFNIPARMGFLNITPKIEEIVHKSGVQEGLLLVNTN